NEGNRTRRTEIATGNYTTYDWDYRNRLVATTDYKDDGTLLQTVTDVYDINNRRIGETVDKVQSDGSHQIEVDRYVFDGDNVVLDFVAHDLSSTPVLAHRYLYGNAVDQIL